MKARSIMLLAALAALAGPAAHGGVTTNTLATQWAYFQYDHFDPATNVQQMGAFYVLSQTGLATSGTTASPVSEPKATAFLWSCDYDNNDCPQPTEYGFQTVSATALTMDPVGNEIQVNACLLPTGGGSCHSFNLTMNHPGALVPFVCAPCGPNVWWDDEAVFASSSGVLGIDRYGYEVAGTFAGAPLGVPQSSIVDSNSGTVLGNSVVALLP